MQRSAAGTASHTPFRPRNLGSRNRKSEIPARLRVNEQKDDSRACDMAVKKPIAKILNPHKGKLRAKSSKPCSVKP